MSNAPAYFVQATPVTPLQRAQEVALILANAILRSDKQLVFTSKQSVHVPQPQGGES